MLKNGPVGPVSGECWTRRRAVAAIAASWIAQRGVARDGPVPALGFQVHAIRRFLQMDFDGTLRRLRQTGYSQVEMCSFPGFRGDHRGDFGTLADASPVDLRRRIRAQGLQCTACNFTPEEIWGERSTSAGAWARGLGVKWIILAGVKPPENLDELDQLCDKLRLASRRLRREGFSLGFHTDQSLWSVLGSKTIVEHLLDRLAPDECAFELDFGGIIAYGIDPLGFLRAYSHRFRWLHLRDGQRPDSPSQYVPAIVPGEGLLDWPAILSLARRTRAEYVVEMETHSGIELEDYVRAYASVRRLFTEQGHTRMG